MFPAFCCVIIPSLITPSPVQPLLYKADNIFRPSQGVLHGSLFYNFTVFQHYNQICVSHGGQSVRDYKSSPVFHQPVHTTLNVFSVLVSTELVASSSIRMGAFDMAARAILRSCRSPWLKFAPSHPIPYHILGQPFDKGMGAGHLGRCNDFFIGCVKTAIPNILSDRSGKQMGILKHHCYIAS